MAKHKKADKKESGDAARRYAAQEIFTGALVGIVLALLVVMSIKLFNRPGNDNTPISPTPEMPAQLITEAEIPSETRGDISLQSTAAVEKPNAVASPDAEETPPNPLKHSESKKVPGLYPEASTRLLSKEELVNKTIEELQLMRNEIFARQSYIFKTPSVSKYFIQQPWYRDQYTSVSNKLSKTEIANIKLIRKHETKKPTSSLRVASHQGKTSTIRFLPPTPEMPQSP